VQAAIDKMQDFKFRPDQHSGIFVARYSPQEQLRSQFTFQNNRLFVKNLPMGTTEEQIHTMFSEFGKVTYVSVRKPQLPPQPSLQMMASSMPINCVAYVTFETEDQAKASFALNKRDPLQKIQVQYFKKEPTYGREQTSEVSYLTLFL
jgi:RNA recognition motif-containing protein